MSTQDSTTNSTSGTSQAAEQNASFQQILLLNNHNQLNEFGVWMQQWTDLYLLLYYR